MAELFRIDRYLKTKEIRQIQVEWKIVDRQNPFEMQKKSFSSNSAFILMKFNQKNNKRRVSEKVNKRKISSAVKFRRMSKLLELFLCFRSNKDGVHYL